MRKSLILLLLLFTFQLFSQSKFNVKQFGFSMDEPQNWVKTHNDGILKNLDRFDFKGEQREEMLKSLNSASTVIAYYKYDPLTTRGIIPTINIAFRPTKVSSNEQFKLYILKSSEKMKSLLENFSQSEPKGIIINGVNAWEVVSSYDYKDPTGQKVKLKSKTVYFYRNDFYTSITLVDEQGKEDNTPLFNEAIATVYFK